MVYIILDKGLYTRDYFSKSEIVCLDGALSATLDFAPTCLMLTDRDFKFLYANKAAFDLFFVNNTEDFINEVSDLFFEKQESFSRYTFADEIAACDKYGTSRFTVEHISEDGNSTIIETALTRLSVPAVDGFICIFHKIADARSVSRENKSSITFLLENSPFATAIFDSTEKPIACNDACFELFLQKSRNDFIYNFEKLIPVFQPDGEKSINHFSALFSETKINGKTVSSFNFYIKNNEEANFEITLTSLPPDTEGNYVLYFRSLQNEQEVFSSIRDSDSHQMLMIDSSPLACVFFNEEFELRECNEAAVKLFGLSNKEEFIDHFFNLSPEFQPNGEKSDDLAAIYLQTAKTEGSYRFDWMHITPK